MNSSAILFGLLRAQFEENNGLYSAVLSVLEETVGKAPPKDLPFLFRLQVAYAHRYFGVSRAREVYKKALELLSGEALVPIGIEFAGVERRLGEIDRARSVFRYLTQFVEPAFDDGRLWVNWEKFEIECGNEDTYKELVRLKKATQQRFDMLPPSLKRVERKLKAENAAVIGPMSVVAEEADDDDQKDN